MIYDLKISLEQSQAKLKLDSYIEKGVVIHLKEKPIKRTISQNSYIHVLFNLFAIEFGYTLAEAKTLLKRQFSDMMIYEKNGEKFLKGTSDLDKDECQVFIEKVRTYSAENGLYMPTSEEYLENQHHIDREVEKNRQYL